MTKSLRIAVGGSATNPLHNGHYTLIEKLIYSKLFDRIIWIPSGVRPYKVGFVEPKFRREMIYKSFPKNWYNLDFTKFEVRYDDIDGENTPTIVWLENLSQQYPGAEITWFTGVDSVVSQKKFVGKCEIEARWVRGEELMRDWNFLIIPRQGYIHPAQLDLPNNFSVLDINIPEISSSEIRRLVREVKPFEHLVSEAVAEIIKENSLYL